MTLKEVDAMRKEVCLLCSKYYHVIGYHQQATRSEMYMEICKPADCFLEEIIRSEEQ